MRRVTDRDLADAARSDTARTLPGLRSGERDGGQPHPNLLGLQSSRSVLALQRSVGNKTVAVMLGAPRSQSSGMVTVQRGNRLYAGNLSFSTSQETIQSAFAAVGEVREVAMPTDRETGQPRGFAFVTMGSAQSAAEAISRLNGTMIDGRALRVNEAQERPARGGGGGGFGGGGGGGGGGRGRY